PRPRAGRARGRRRGTASGARRRPGAGRRTGGCPRRTARGPPRGWCPAGPLPRRAPGRGRGPQAPRRRGRRRRAGTAGGWPRTRPAGAVPRRPSLGARLVARGAGVPVAVGVLVVLVPAGEVADVEHQVDRRPVLQREGDVELLA